MRKLILPLTALALAATAIAKEVGADFSFPGCQDALMTMAAEYRVQLNAIMHRAGQKSNTGVEELAQRGARLTLLKQRTEYIQAIRNNMNSFSDRLDHLLLEKTAQTPNGPAEIQKIIDDFQRDKGRFPIEVVGRQTPVTHGQISQLSKLYEQAALLSEFRTQFFTKFANLVPSSGKMDTFEHHHVLNAYDDTVRKDPRPDLWRTSEHAQDIMKAAEKLAKNPDVPKKLQEEIDANLLFLKDLGLDPSVPFATLVDETQDYLLRRKPR